MITKRLLKDWRREVKKDIGGLPYSQISEATGINRTTIKNYLTLTGQNTFDPEVIKKINDYRDEYLDSVKQLSTSSI